jgi:hypothetical protein
VVGSFFIFDLLVNGGKQSSTNSRPRQVPILVSPSSSWRSGVLAVHNDFPLLTGGVARFGAFGATPKSQLPAAALY